MRLIVYSRSTEKYIDDWDYDKKLLVTEPPTKSILKHENTEDAVIAIGGGSVIDTAKIICSDQIVAIPTTFAGASQTSHAVYWDSEKHSIKTKKPLLVLMPSYLKGLPEDVKAYSKIDCLCHVMESLVSKNANDESKKYANKAVKLIHNGNWFIASIYAGDAIEITGTNVLHGLSYPLTAKYGIPHGKALATVIHEALDLDKVRELL